MTFLQKLLELHATTPDAELSEKECQSLISVLIEQLRSDGTSSDLARCKGMRIVGQDDLVKRLVSSIVLNEHILLEGLPGVAKTTAVKFLAQDSGLFSLRVQFFPDMQPSDLVGKNRFDILKLQASAQPGKHYEDGEIENWENGPLFVNFLVADEINRAPSKVQASLLEAMAERQITPLGHNTHVIRSSREWEMWLRHIRCLQEDKTITDRSIDIWNEFNETIGKTTSSELTPDILKPAIRAINSQRLNQFGKHFPFGVTHGWSDPKPLFGATPINLTRENDAQFSVFATQNPVEQQGTYPLSEAQTDRFCFKTIVDYPDFDALKDIARMINRPKPEPDPDIPFTLDSHEEHIATDRSNRDRAVRCSLYYFRRCREILFGAPGEIKDSSLGKLFAAKKSPLLDKIARLTFYSHIKMPATGRRGSSAAYLYNEEQQDRMNYLHRNDHKTLSMLNEPDNLFQYINYGSSPRGMINLTRAALANALIEGRALSTPDIKAIAPDVLRHRIRLNAQARIQDVTADNVVESLLRFTM